MNSERGAITAAEGGLEASVSEYIGRMPFLWLDVDDAPGPNSKRGLIERNAIALLSGHRCAGVDNPSTDWLVITVTANGFAARDSGTTIMLKNPTTHYFLTRWNPGLQSQIRDLE